MDTLKPNMYVRTKNSGICKLYREFFEDSVNLGIGTLSEIDGFFIDEEEIDYIEKKDVLKASYNIIDLIEEGDYVNGYKVLEICTGNFELNNPLNIKALKLEFIKEDINPNIPFFKRYNFITNSEIKSIVTKEQFDSMKYEVDSNV